MTFGRLGVVATDRRYVDGRPVRVGDGVTIGIPAQRQPVRSPGRGWGVLAVGGLVVAFSLSSTLVKRAETPGVLVAFWRMTTVSVVWNAYLWSTGRRVTMRD